MDDIKLEVEKSKQKLAVETAGFESRLASEQQQVANQDAQTQRLTEEIEQLKSQFAQTQQQLEAERTNNAELNRECESRRGTIESLNAKLEASDALSAVNQQLQNAMERQEQRMVEMEAAHQSSLQRLESLIVAQPAEKTEKTEEAQIDFVQNDGFGYG